MTPDEREGSADTGLKDDVLIGGLFLIPLDTQGISYHPLLDSAIRIMVERVHIHRAERTIFESVAGDLLQQLGYSLYTPLDLLKGSFSDEEIVFFNEENIRLKNVFIQQADPADLAKRRPQDELINRIKQY